MARFFNAAYTLPSQRNVVADILVIANLVFTPGGVYYGPLRVSE